MDKFFIKIIRVIVFIIVICMGCERKVEEVTDSDNNSDTENNSVYSEDESDYDWDSTIATVIELKVDMVEISGTGASYNGKEVIIATGGEYWITGQLTNGQIKIAALKEDKVKLILDNVNINCNNDAVLYSEKSARTILLLADESENTLSDGSSFSSDEVNATVFSKTDLVIGGMGKLIVNANINDGITSKDGLIINSGVFSIDAADDGIRGKDYLVVNDGSFNITSGGDALKSDNENTGCGYVNVKKGEFLINSMADGISAVNNLSITDGSFDISCKGTTSSSKGLKAGVMLNIDNGSYQIESVDDGLHSDDDINIQNGNFIISTNDDGLHADNTISIHYANISINKSYEGIEAKTIDIKDGIFKVISSDDGINAASGDGNTQMGWPPQQGVAGDNTLNIEGGTIFVYSNGDGIDINGSVTMTGGELIVHGPVANNNGALDYDGTFILTNGFIVAAGSSGMAQIPSSSSSKYSVLINFSSSYSENTLFHLQDAAGNNLITFSPAHTYQSVALSLPEFKNGETYYIYSGGSSTGADTEGLYTGGVYTPGTLYDSFTITGINTTVGTSSGGRPGGF